MNTYDKVIKLALERGFYFPSCEVYADAPAGFWEYGPSGVSLKNKFIELWRRELVRRDRMLEIDGSQVMSQSVFEASGHLTSFADPIIKCNKCGLTYRADKLINEAAKIEIAESDDPDVFDKTISENNITCPKCNGDFAKTKKFNMMFKVEIGPDRDPAYLRPETCQSIFVDFPRLYKTQRGRLPMGVAQIGKSFRNEISPRQSLLRLREFYQAEIEVFCNKNRLDAVDFAEVENQRINLWIQKNHNDNKTKQSNSDDSSYYDINESTCKNAVESGLVPNKLVAYYLGLLAKFYEKTGIDTKKSRFRKLSDKEKAFYADVAFDFEVNTSIGWLELVACNYRSDYDLTSHSKISKEKFEVIDADQKVLPHVFELSMGIDRSLYTILEHAYKEEKENERILLSMKPYLSPIHVGVLSLVKKDGLYEKTNEIYKKIRTKTDAFLDHSGAIGRRYRRLDEVGVPYAITIDHQTTQDDTVTVRERDSMRQDRIKVSELEEFITSKVSFP